MIRDEGRMESSEAFKANILSNREAITTMGSGRALFGDIDSVASNALHGHYLVVRTYVRNLTVIYLAHLVVSVGSIGVNVYRSLNSVSYGVRYSMTRVGVCHSNRQISFTISPGGMIS